MKSIDDSSDISDEEKELCSTVLSLQSYQLEPERESSESEVNNNINKESTTKHLEVRVGNCNCECGKCSGIKEREIDCLCCREMFTANYYFYF